jgi:hypothetical protein
MNQGLDANVVITGKNWDQANAQAIRALEEVFIFLKNCSRNQPLVVSESFVGT